MRKEDTTSRLKNKEREVMDMGDIATLRNRMSATTETIRDCANLLGINEPPTEKHVDEDTIDQLMEGFDILDGLGAVIRDQLGRL